MKWANKVKSLPRIYFLDPTVIEMFETEQRKAVCLLIEPLLEGTYEKFNNNMGYVKGQAQYLSKNDTLEKIDEKPILDQIQGIDLSALLGNLHISGPTNLGAIVEEEEEEESSSDEEELFCGATTNRNFASDYTNAQALLCKDLDDKHFPQAFSHFSYVHSKKRFMVVDLQGVFSNELGGTKCYKLTGKLQFITALTHKKEYPFFI